MGIIAMVVISTLTRAPWRETLDMCFVASTRFVVDPFFKGKVQNGGNETDRAAGQFGEGQLMLWLFSTKRKLFLPMSGCARGSATDLNASGGQSVLSPWATARAVVDPLRVLGVSTMSPWATDFLG